MIRSPKGIETSMSHTVFMFDIQPREEGSPRCLTKQLQLKKQQVMAAAFSFWIKSEIS